MFKLYFLHSDKKWYYSASPAYGAHWDSCGDKAVIYETEEKANEYRDWLQERCGDIRGELFVERIA